LPLRQQRQKTDPNVVRNGRRNGRPVRRERVATDEADPHFQRREKAKDRGGAGEMESIISRKSYLMVASLIEEFMEDSGTHSLHDVEAFGLRKIKAQMERRGSRGNPFDTFGPDNRIEPVRPLDPGPKFVLRPRKDRKDRKARDRDRKRKHRETPAPKPRYVASKEETHRLYLAMKAKHAAKSTAPAPSSNGIVPPWSGDSQWAR
jgi:hypothetical protein